MSRLFTLPGLIATPFLGFDKASIETLQKASFIFVQNGDGHKFVKPSDCYVGKGDDDSMRSRLFTWVDFGAKAQAFLIACGVRPEPTPQQIVDMLLSDPQAFLKLAATDAA